MNCNFFFAVLAKQSVICWFVIHLVDIRLTKLMYSAVSQELHIRINRKQTLVLLLENNRMNAAASHEPINPPFESISVKFDSMTEQQLAWGCINCSGKSLK